MKDIDEQVCALAASQHGVFSRRQMREFGASGSACDRRLRGRRWLRTQFAGVFVVAGFAVSWRQRLMAAVLAGPEGTVASHRSAAVLYGIRDGEPIELIVPPGTRLEGALAHHSAVAAHERRVVDGIPTTRVERALIDLAAVVDDDEVESAVEAALRKGHTTVERLLPQLSVPRPGRARFRRVLERRTCGRPAGSELEVRLIQLLRAAGLPAPVRQHEVRVGGERYFLDIAYPDRRLCIEVDGREAHEGAAFQRDRSRQNALVLAGWTVLRFTWADVVERPDEVVAVIGRAMAA